MYIVIFNTITEEILQTGVSKVPFVLPEVVANKIFAGRHVNPLDYTVREITTAYTTNQFKQFCYIESGVVHRKSNIDYLIDKTDITADGFDKATFSGIDEGIEVFISGVLMGTVELDGVVEITSAIPKVMNITLQHDHYLPEEIIINAN